MDSSGIEIIVNDFRAISQAKIDLNGITVVAGENGCGKSTIAQILFNVIYVLNHFEDLIYKDLEDKLYPLLKFVDDVSVCFLSSKEKDNGTLFFRQNRVDESIKSILRKDCDFLQKKSSVLSILKQIENYIIELKDPFKLKLVSLAMRKFFYFIDDFDSDEKLKKKKSFSGFDRIFSFVDEMFDVSNDELINRKNDILNKHLFDIFHDSSILKKIDIKEFDESLNFEKNNTLNLISSVRNVFYVDSPILFEQNNERFNHKLYRKICLSAIKLVNSSPVSSEMSELIKEITSKVMNGSAYYKGELLDDFRFKRKDGKIFSLDECATGLKSFALLQILMSNGSLNKDSLVILDEPEAYLHPQWIVEYARLMVLLHRKIGVKFFIATHNPDMVNALRWISQKENIHDNVVFYLAKISSSKKYLYKYENLGLNIEPIFKSFNIALDRIEKYGCFPE